MTTRIDLSFILRFGGILLAGINTIFLKIPVLDIIAIAAMVIGIFIFYKNASPSEKTTANSRLAIIGIGAVIFLIYLLVRFAI